MDSGCLIVILFNLFMIFILFKFLALLFFTPVGWVIILIWILFSTFGGQKYKRRRDEEYYRNWENAYREYRNYQYQENVNQTNYKVEKSMKILGITQLSKNTVSSAFRKLSKKYHPDVCKEDRNVCENIYKDITSAYEYLMEYMNSNNIN